MIGLDTKVFVRYLAQDDPVQSPIATDIMEFRVTEDNPGFISVVAMVETVWVLDRAYALSASEIAAALGRILQTDTLVVESEQEVFQATMAPKEGTGSFAVIGALGAKAGCARTLTFDKSALRLPGFELVCAK